MAVANGLNPTFIGSATVNATTGITANGVLMLQLGDATCPALYVGSGAPTLTAIKGSLYIRTDGSSTSTRMYVNTTGSTTWTNFTTAA